MPDISQSFETKQYKTHSKRWFLIIKDPIDPTINALPISRSLSNDHLMVRTVKNLLSSELTANYYVEKAHTAMDGDPYYDPPVYADGQTDRVPDPEMRFALFNRTYDENTSFDGNQRHYTAMVFSDHDEAKEIYTINDLCPTWLNESSNDDLNLPFSCGNTFLWKSTERIRVKQSLELISVIHSKSPEGVMMVTVYFPDGTILYTTVQNYRWMKSLFYELSIDFEINGGLDFVRGSHRDYYQKVVLQKPIKKNQGTQELTDMDDEDKSDKKHRTLPTKKSELNNDHYTEHSPKATTENAEKNTDKKSSADRISSQHKNTDTIHHETITQEVVDVFIELIEEGDHEIAKAVLQEYGKNLLFCQHSKLSGDTALHSAFKHNNKKMITFIKEYCSKHDINYRKLTAIKNKDEKVPFQLERTLSNLSFRISSEENNIDDMTSIQYDNKRNEEIFYSTIVDQADSLCTVCFSDEDVTFNFSGEESCRGHQICTPCMQNFIDISAGDTSLSQNGIVCPADGCDQVFQEHIIRFIGGNDNLKKINKLMLKSTVLKSKNLFQCLNPLCDNIVDLGENPTAGRLTCPECKSTACVSCKVTPYHEGFFCSGFQASMNKEQGGLVERAERAEELTTRLIKKKINKFKCCPTCKSIINKDGGCNKVFCSHCHTSFCWICLEKVDNERYTHFMTFDGASGNKNTGKCPLRGTLEKQGNNDEGSVEANCCEYCKAVNYTVLSCGHKVCQPCYDEMCIISSLRPAGTVVCNLCFSEYFKAKENSSVKQNHQN